MNPLIGRIKEQTILNKALISSEAEMIAIIGRRRVGKTFLVKSVYANQIKFQLSGIQNASFERQLENFAYQLTIHSGAESFIPTPKNWFRAFIALIEYLKKLPTNQKYVVFLDEVPWMSTHKSDFLQGLSFFWNSWAVDQNIVVVICGSAASWMVQKIVNHTGGLHNRITKRIHLQPFTLAETEAYLKSRNIPTNHYHIVQIYMALGGIPHYLKEIEAGKSAVQNINDICFADAGLLKDEFSKLYAALFDNSERHIAVIRTLASKRQGMTRNEIIAATAIKNGGSLSKVLVELEQSGFISIYYPYGKKKKDKLYRLTDEYSLFYLYFIEKNIYQGEQTWHHLSQTQSYKTWSGYTFESICLKHLPQIKKGLSIGGVYSIAASFVKKGTSDEKGTQIDLLLDRKDQVINLFEIKYYKQPYTITKAYAQALREKQAIFQATTKTNKLILWTLITPFGLKQNQHSVDLIYNVLDLKVLFEAK